MGGYAAAIRRVLEHPSLRDKFCGVRAELAELGFSGVEITQEGPADQGPRPGPRYCQP